MEDYLSRQQEGNKNYIVSDEFKDLERHLHRQDVKISPQNPLHILINIELEVCDDLFYFAHLDAAGMVTDIELVSTLHLNFALELVASSSSSMSSSYVSCVNH